MKTDWQGFHLAEGKVKFFSLCWLELPARKVIACRDGI